MKVALDTNVLVSAYTARGLSADVFRLVLAEHELVLSETVLSEFEDVTLNRFGVPPRLVEDILAELRLHHVQPRPRPQSVGLGFIRDADDRFVVASAMAARADVLVTGDRDILDERAQIEGLSVFTPREFWEFVRSKGE